MARISDSLAARLKLGPDDFISSRCSDTYHRIHSFCMELKLQLLASPQERSIVNAATWSTRGSWVPVAGQSRVLLCHWERLLLRWIKVAKWGVAQFSSIHLNHLRSALRSASCDSNFSIHWSVEEAWQAATKAGSDPRRPPEGEKLHRAGQDPKTCDTVDTFDTFGTDQTFMFCSCSFHVLQVFSCISCSILSFFFSHDHFFSCKTLRHFLNMCREEFEEGD